MLLVSSAFFLLSRESNIANPSIANTKPSGLAAFAQLLRENGYQVVIDRSEEPKVSPKEIVVAVNLKRVEQDFENPFAPAQDANNPGVWRTLLGFQSAGGALVVLHLMQDFELTTVNIKTVTATTPQKEKRKVTIFEGGLLEAETVGFPLLVEQETGQALIHLSRTRTTSTLEVLAAEPFTNRFLGREDNAAVALNAIQAIAPRGATVRFVEGSFGNTESMTNLRRIGAWAEAMKWQFFLLAAVVIGTLGIRFGRAATIVQKARGSRELFDAMADVMLRARQDPFVLRAIIDAGFERVRVASRQPLGTEPKKLLENKSPELIEAFRAAEAVWRDERGRPKDCTEAAARLDAELIKFEQDSRDVRQPKESVK